MRFSFSAVAVQLTSGGSCWSIPPRKSCTARSVKRSTKLSPKSMAFSRPTASAVPMTLVATTMNEAHRKDPSSRRACKIQYKSHRSSFGTLPFHQAGCRTVTGLVPRALFIGILYMLYMINVPLLLFPRNVFLKNVLGESISFSRYSLQMHFL